MTDYPIPDAVLVHHAAFLGKTRSGKTSSAKTAVERFVAAGERVCVLDPIKSDWWGMTSSPDGQSAGLPFQILGGPHGHVPLHSSSGRVIGELVATGALPLSIIDMAWFEGGGLQRFFCDFAETLMRHQRGVLHLVIEEAHEFAPKERAGIGDENMAIHWAKKLATAGGSKGIRLIVATQSIQQLHNRVLGSCETMVAHRLTAPADQKPVVDWLKANVEKSLAAEIASGLSGLPTGTAWVCSGEAKMFEKIEFPRISTFDNSATPMSDDEAAKVTTAPVDVDALRGLIGDAVEIAEANDPKKLRAEVKRLTAELEAAGTAPLTEEAIRQHRLFYTLEGERDDLVEERDQLKAEVEKQTARAEHYDACIENAVRALGYRDIEEIGRELEDKRFNEGLKPARRSTEADQAKAIGFARELDAEEEINEGNEGGGHELASAARGSDAPVIRSAPSAGNGHLPKAEQDILDALLWCDVLYRVSQHDRHIVAVLVGNHVRTKGFLNRLGSLRSAGLINYGNGTLFLTSKGKKQANTPDVQPTVASARAAVKRILTPRQAQILDMVIPAAQRRDFIAGELGLHERTKGFLNDLGRLRGLKLIDYGAGGTVQAEPFLR